MKMKVYVAVFQIFLSSSLQNLVYQRLYLRESGTYREGATPMTSAASKLPPTL